MERIWHDAPAAALHVWHDAQGRHAEPNAAAAAWAARHGMSADDWLALAADSGADARVGGHPVGVRRVALDDGGGALLWLQLPDSAGTESRLDAAQRASAFLDRALGLAGVTVWRWDMQTRRVHFNAVGFELLGMEQDPAGVTLDQLIAGTHPDDRAEVLRAARLALARDGVVDVVARHRRVNVSAEPDAAWRTLLTRRVADHDDAGRLSGLAGVTLDLTRQFAERARADTLDTRARLVADAVGVGFWSRDVGSGVAFWDAQMCRIHGRPADAGAPGADEWIDLCVHPQDRDRVRHRQQCADASWQPALDFTFRACDADDGSERWVQSWTRRALRDGRRVLFGMHLDVSERQREQAQLRRERARAQFAIEAADVGVWERTLDGSVAYWNDAMYRLRGLPPDDPRPIVELAHGCIDDAGRAGLAQLVAQHMASGDPLRHECRISRPDGSTRWLLMHGRAIRDGAGTLLGMAGIDIDITERREADAMRQEMARADAARRDKSAFLARVSHELRTPMNAVLGFTHLIDDDRSERPTPRQRARLQRIADAGRQMMALVDDLLELSSLDADAPAAAPVATPLAPAVQQALDTLAPLAQTEGVALAAGDLATCGAVLADPRRLAQLLSLLATHALRTQRRGGHVRIEASRDTAGIAPQVVLDLNGDGPGYGEAEAATLFEPFLRHGAAGSSGAGTGLGLALAQRLAQAMGGDIGLAGGRVLRLRLPAARDDPAPAPEPVAAGTQAQTLRVLCVEDNPVNLLLVRELLSLRPGVVLRVAVDGTSAIAMALADPPDVLLLDLQLPDISGTEVLLRLRAEAAMAGCTFVALSADAMPEHIARARAAGFDDYWTKPIEFNRFLAGIDRLASRVG